MTSEKGTDDPAGPDAAEPAWLRNRRLRQAELEAANARGEQLLERYGRATVRPGYAFVGHAGAERRRRHR
jgi:hypothetical protein